MITRWPQPGLKTRLNRGPIGSRSIVAMPFLEGNGQGSHCYAQGIDALPYTAGNNTVSAGVSTTQYTITTATNGYQNVYLGMSLQCISASGSSVGNIGSIVSVSALSYSSPTLTVTITPALGATPSAGDVFYSMTTDGAWVDCSAADGWPYPPKRAFNCYTNAGSPRQSPLCLGGGGYASLGAPIRPHGGGALKNICFFNGMSGTAIAGNVYPQGYSIFMAFKTIGSANIGYTCDSDDGTGYNIYGNGGGSGTANMTLRSASGGTVSNTLCTFDLTRWLIMGVSFFPLGGGSPAGAYAYANQISGVQQGAGCYLQTTVPTAANDHTCLQTWGISASETTAPGDLWIGSVWPIGIGTTNSRPLLGSLAFLHVIGSPLGASEMQRLFADPSMMFESPKAPFSPTKSTGFFFGG